MAATEEMKEIVRRGSEAFAEIEQALADIVSATEDLKQVYHDGAKAGMAGGHAVAMQISDFNKWIGAAGDLESMVYAAHAKSTAIAKENGADDALPEGYVTIQGGGR